MSLVKVVLKELENMQNEHKSKEHEDKIRKSKNQANGKGYGTMFIFKSNISLGT